MRYLLRILIVATVAAALVTVELSSRSGVAWRLITFTYQANVLAAAFYTWALLSVRAAARDGIRGAVVLYVLVAGLIWNVFLTDYSMGYTAANILLHIAVPVLVLVDWLVVGATGRRVTWWQPMVWLIYPAAYALLALLVLNRAGRRAPYYFLDPQSVGTAVVAANVGLLAMLILLMGYALSAGPRWRAGSSRSATS